MNDAVRDLSPSAIRPVVRRLCVVMVCTDMREAEQVGRQLSEFDNGCLVTYRRAEGLRFNAPAGRVALAILANADPLSGMRRTLKWLRHQWPRSSIAVVGDVGCGEHEIAAREEGAMFLTRPVGQEQWTAILSHALGPPRQKVEEVRERFEAGDASRPINGR